MSDQKNPADAWKPRERRSGSTDYLKIKAGETVSFRILSKEPFVVWGHRIVVKGVGRPVTCLDQSKVENEKIGCPACDNGTKKTYRNAVAVLDRRDGQVKLWEFSDQLKGSLHTMVTTWKKLPHQFDVALSRIGSTKDDTRYSLTIAPNQDELTEKEKELDVINLAEYYKPNRERMLTLLDGKLPERKESEEEVQSETNTVAVPTSEPVNPLNDTEEIV